VRLREINKIYIKRILRDENGEKKQHWKVKDKGRQGLRQVGGEKEKKVKQKWIQEKTFSFSVIFMLFFSTPRIFYFSNPILRYYYSLHPPHKSNSIS